MKRTLRDIFGLDQANIRFVNAHAEGVSGHYCFQFTGHERILILLALTCLRATVIFVDHSFRRLPLHLSKEPHEEPLQLICVFVITNPIICADVFI